MKFINQGKSRKFRRGTYGSFSWISLDNGEIIELGEAEGKKLRLNIVEAEEGKIGKTKIETKQIKDNFPKELKKINGIGKKTVKDILLIYPTKEQLKTAISKGRLPFDDDIELKLRKKWPTD